ncbi:MFS transporter [Rhodobacteraceae bacterium 2CG4]|uniref:MFS transporter n=1 Tax=Halovulum marinum TaxID=2662447 RepID=A0A6L5Z3U8_9RHOB|nr:MFS transporter [Halovulum marinum]MSU91216.1 MFS transporter [Halovulum marinum]
MNAVLQTTGWPRDRGFVARHALAQLLLWSAFYYLLPAILPRLLAETGWSAVTVSAAMTAGFVLWALLSPLAGHVVDRGRAAQAMRLAGVLGAGLLLAAALAQDMRVAGAALVLLGGPMAMTLYDPCFSVMIRRYGAGARGAITAVTLVAGFATLLTFPLVAVLDAAGAGWRGTMILFAAAALLGVALLPREAAAARRTAQPQPQPPVAGTGRAVALGTAFALIMFGHALLLFQLPVQLMRATGEDAALLLPMVLGPAQIAGRLAWEAARSRLRLERAAPGLFALMLLPPVLLLLVDGLAAALAALVIQGAGYGVHTILRPLLAAHWLPAAGFARRLGVIAMIGLLMMAVAPLAGAWIAAGYGFGGLLGLVLLADLAGLTLLLGLVAAARRGAWA